MGERRDYRNETTTFHFDVEGQANPQFSHRNDWTQHCSVCLARYAEIVSKDAEILDDIRLTQQLIEDALVWGYEIGEDPAFVLAPYLGGDAADVSAR